MSSARCIASSLLSRLSDAVDVCSQHESALLVRLLSSDNRECRLLRIDEGQATELDVDRFPQVVVELLKAEIDDTTLSGK